MTETDAERRARVTAEFLAIYTPLHEAALAAMPHCSCCGQVLRGLAVGMCEAHRPRQRVKCADCGGVIIARTQPRETDPSGADGWEAEVLVMGCDCQPIYECQWMLGAFAYPAGKLPVEIGAGFGLRYAGEARGDALRRYENDPAIGRRERNAGRMAAAGPTPRGRAPQDIRLQGAAYRSVRRQDGAGRSQ